MAKLYFRHGAMGSSKTANALMVRYNYLEKGQNVVLLKPAGEDRDGADIIRSRIGLSAECLSVEAFLETFPETFPEIFPEAFPKAFPEAFAGTAAGAETMDPAATAAHDPATASAPAAIIVDEAQFLSPDQVDRLSDLVDDRNIPVICYGLRTDFQGKLFPGSRRLLELADEIEEIPTVCWCGHKAHFNARICGGRIVREGEQVMLGSNDVYVSLCRRHFKNGEIGPLA